MSSRIDYAKVSPAALQAAMGMARFVRKSGLEQSLVELVNLRASYINGCAYCVDMHTKDARAAGETEQRLYSVPVWEETPYYTSRERAALKWTEYLTRISELGVPDEVFNDVREEFNDDEMVALTMAVNTICMWNRLAVGFRADVGSYEPQAQHAGAQ